MAGKHDAVEVTAPLEAAEAADAPTSEDSTHASRRDRVGVLIQRLVEAIRTGDDDSVEAAILALSQRSRWLAPLALLVGGFAMLFQGVKTLFTNWRLSLVQILPAMWIWIAMFDLKAHVLHGKAFHVFKGPQVVIPIVLAIAAVTAASFYLNAVFAFAITASGSPEIRPAFAQAKTAATFRSATVKCAPSK